MGSQFVSNKTLVTANSIPIANIGANYSWVALPGSGIASGGNNPTVSGFLAGDANGPLLNNVVLRINSNPLGVTTPTVGNILIADGIKWNSVSPSGSIQITPSGSLYISNTGVIPGTYGDSNHIAVVTVGSDGRVNNISTISITSSSPSGFPVGGVLTGTLPDPGLASTGVSAGTYGSINTVPVVTVGLDGRITNISIVSISGGSGSNINLKGINYNSGNILIADGTGYNSFLTSGDTSMTVQGSVTVDGINSNPLGVTTPIAGNILVADGIKWNSVTPSGLIIITPSGSIYETSTGVLAGFYGDSSHVASFQVNVKGRLVGASGIPINFPVIPNTAIPSGATGGVLTGTYPNPSGLNFTGVISGIYGSNNQVPQIVVNGEGRITSLSLVTINFPIIPNTAIPSGIASGVLTGSYPNPSGLAFTGVTVGTYGSSNQVAQVIVNGEGRIISASNVNINFPSIPNTAIPSGNAGGVLTGTYPNPSGLNFTGVTPSTYGSSNQVAEVIINGEGRVTSASNVTINFPAIPNTAIPSGNTGGILTGTYPNPSGLVFTGVTIGTYGSNNQVAQITVNGEGRVISASNIAINFPAIPNTAVPSGNAGGDLANTYPNPTVANINSNPLGVTTPIAGNILVSDGTRWNSVSLSGLLAITPSGSIYPVFSPGINSYGSNNQVAQITLDQYNRITTASNVIINFPAIPNTAIPSGAAGGDLSGTYPNPTVQKLNSYPLQGINANSGNILIGQGSGYQSYAVSGAGTINNTGVLALTSTGVTAGSYGSNNQVVSITVNAAGQITAASNTTINFPKIPNTAIPSGAAGGDLGSNYPNPIVRALESVALAGSCTTAGQFYAFYNGSLQVVVPSGDVILDSMSTTNYGYTVQGIQGFPVSTTDPTTNQLLVYNGNQYIPSGNLTLQQLTVNGFTSISGVPIDPINTSGDILGTFGNGYFGAPPNHFFKVPQVTVYTSGTGSYSVPSNTLYLTVEMAGGGGGGGLTTGTAGTSGNPSSFGTSLLTANGGAGGAIAAGSVATAPTSTINSPAITILNIRGQVGVNAGFTVSAGATYGAGGDTPVFGGGSNNTAVIATANTGGGGCGSANGSSSGGGYGGNSGAYLKAIVPTPSGSYSYSVGNGGAAGGAGPTAGAIGVIIVSAFFQ